MKVYVARQGVYLIGVYTTAEALRRAAEQHQVGQAAERGVIWVNEVEVDGDCVCHPVSLEAESR